jgi:hypothetical protein
MFKMGSNDSFGYLKHKLWPKEGLGIKLPIWLSTTKSQKLPWLPCVQVACHILLEISWRGLQLFFRHHFNQRYAQEVMTLQSCKKSNFRNFRTFNLGVPRQNDIWVQAVWPKIENIIRGRCWFPPSLGCGESCESMFAHGLFVH